MRASSRWGRRYGLRPVYVAGCVVYAFGFLLWGLISSATIVSLLTVFEGMAFGLLFTTGVVVVGQMLPSNLYSTGESLSATVGFGLGPILGAGIGGFVYDRFGSTTLYVGASRSRRRRCRSLSPTSSRSCDLGAPRVRAGPPRAPGMR